MNVSQSSVTESNYYLFKTDDKGNVVFVDPLLLGQLSKSESEVKGKHCKLLLPLNHTGDEYDDIFSAVQSNQIWEGDVTDENEHHSNLYRMAVTTSCEDDGTYGYIFILTPKKNNKERSKSNAKSNHGHGLFGKKLSLLWSMDYKASVMVTLVVCLLFAMKGILAQTTALVAIVLLTIAPVLAIALWLDNWSVIRDKQTFNEQQSDYASI